MEVLTLQPQEPAVAVRPTWRIDQHNSLIRFSIRHMIVSSVHGRFDGPQGVIHFDRRRPWSSKVEAEINPASIDTGIVRRDDHLRSPDFFDVARFPTVTFQSTHVQTRSAARNNCWFVTGDLTILGVTRSVSVDVRQIEPPGHLPPDVLRFRATASINRRDFGMNFFPIEGGGLVIGDDVKIVMNIKAVRSLS